MSGCITAFRAVWLPVAVSRLAVIASTLYLSPRLRQGAPPADFWSAPRPIARLFRFDAHYYMAVATRGYLPAAAPVPVPPYRAAFFPLYPTAVRTLTAAGADPSWAAITLSFAAFAAAMLVFHALAADLVGGGAATWAVWLLCFYPWSIFFSYPYAESVFLLALVAGFWLLERRRPLWAGALAALAAAARPPGIALAAVLAVEAHTDRRRRLRLVAAAAIACCGLLAVSLLQLAQTGRPLAFLSAQTLWAGHPRNPLFPFAVTARAAVRVDWSNPQALGLPVLAVFSIAAVRVARRLPFRYSALTVPVLLVAAYHAWTVDDFYSLPRYLAISFPSFFVIADALRSSRAARAMGSASIALSALLLIVYAAEYGAWNFVG